MALDLAGDTGLHSDAPPPSAREAAIENRLRPGPHDLTREQVTADQRRRIFRALSDSMAEKGFAATTVADVVERAGVSRQTFYQEFGSKQACFMAAFEMLQKRVVSRALPGTVRGDGHERFAAALHRYLEGIAADPVMARLFLVEVYAAGPEALRRRFELQQAIIDRLMDEFDATTVDDRFACRTLVTVTAALVTQALVSDPAEIPALEKPLTAMARRLLPPTPARR